jgi:hypothetical protein
MAMRRGKATTATGNNTENHTILNEEVIFRLLEPVIINNVETHAVRGGSAEFKSLVKPSSVNKCEGWR